MVVGAINGVQNPSFVELVNQPQIVSANNAQQMSAYEQPRFDSYEGPRQEKEKSSLLSKLFKTVLFAGALVGLNRIAHNSKLIKNLEGSGEGIMQKYIQKPLNVVDEYVMKTYNKWFPKTGSAPIVEPAATK